MSTLIKKIAEPLQQEHQMIGAAAKELKDLVERRPDESTRRASWVNSVRDSLLSLELSSEDSLCLREVWRLYERGGGPAAGAR